MAKDNTLKNETFKDVFAVPVHVGDSVALLVKYYGFRGIDSAHLKWATYLGKGQWGYEFHYKVNGASSRLTRVRIRYPEVVKMPEVVRK